MTTRKAQWVYRALAFVILLLAFFSYDSQARGLGYGEPRLHGSKKEGLVFQYYADPDGMVSGSSEASEILRRSDVRGFFYGKDEIARLLSKRTERGYSAVPFKRSTLLSCGKCALVYVPNGISIKELIRSRTRWVRESFYQSRLTWQTIKDFPYVSEVLPAGWYLIHTGVYGPSRRGELFVPNRYQLEEGTEYAHPALIAYTMILFRGDHLSSGNHSPMTGLNMTTIK